MTNAPSRLPLALSLGLPAALVAGMALPTPHAAPTGDVLPRPIDASLFDGRGPDVRSFTLETTVEAPPSDVFRAWTDGPTWLRTYGPDRPELVANIDLAIGGRYEWLFDGETGSNGCQVLSYVPDRMVSFTWNAPPDQPASRAKRTWVVVELEERGPSTTRLRLTHLGFGETEPWDETFAYFQRAWPVVLNRFAEAFSG